MNYLQVKHLDFVPGKLVNGADKEAICIFTHKFGKRVYKKKNRPTGQIFFHPKAKEWVFIGLEKNCFTYEYMRIVMMVLFKLNESIIKFNAEEGELYENKD